MSYKNYEYFVYIMASDSGTLYIGITNDLNRRVSEHKLGLHEGFTKRYACHKLVYYEQYNDAYDAINREKQLKRWRRAKKEWLIATINKTWRDLSISLT
jgi:putative endonuclease